MDASHVAGRKAAPAALLPVFAATLLSSALLMFLIQPMVAKTLLPALGGSPQVWNTCMVFFQALLFGGYLYAHLSAKWLGTSRQLLLHFVLLALAVLMLPLGIEAARLTQPDESRPVWWLIQTLGVSIGLPVFVMAATAPLVQAWFARTAHRSASDPYFLYVSSNVGSFVALLAYPVLVEPLSDLGQQWAGWSLGYAALAALLLACMGMVWRGRHPQPANAVTAERPAGTHALASEAPTWPMRLRWLMLAFVPSSLLMGVTTFITTDVAAVPLFWVLPLALYLLTFMLAFAHRQWLPQAMVVRIQAFTVILLAVSLLIPPVLHAFPWTVMALHLLTFFVAALMCHGELNRLRPSAHYLTEFYLWLSFGGVMGGIFNALVAPVAFDRLLEYPIALALACLLRPRTGGAQRRLMVDMGLPVVVLLMGWTALYGAANLAAAWPKLALVLLVLATVGVAVSVLAFSERPLRFGLAIALMLAIPWLPDNLKFTSAQGVATEWTGRSFFGTYKVNRNDRLGLHVFVHGSTLHGVQMLDPQRTREPGTYYHPRGAFGQILQAAAPWLGNRPVGVVGLGVGSLACYRPPAAAWTFYEIDPLVEAVARDARYFSFLRDCAPEAPVVLGDARIALRAASAGQYGVLVIDAFSSDAIPTHLLTREAVQLYLDKLAPDGWLVIHISNRFLDLLPPVAALAADAGLAARVSNLAKVAGADGTSASPARVVVLSRDAVSLAALPVGSSWAVVDTSRPTRIWTDSYVNVLGALAIRSQPPQAPAPDQR